MDRMIITSRKNPHLAELADTAKNPEPGRALAEGIHLCQEAFYKSSVKILELCLTEPFAAMPEGRGFIAAAERRGTRVTLLSPDCYGKITQLQAPEGAAVLLEPLETPLEELLNRPGGRFLVAAGVQDPGNAGALARLAEAAGADAVLYAGSVNPRKGRFLRAAMGSAFRLPCLAVEADTLPGRLRAAGIPLYAAAKTAGSVDFRETARAERYALAVGAEGLGVPENFLRAAEKIIHLPMHGQVESLNVAVAAGILLYRLQGLS